MIYHRQGDLSVIMNIKTKMNRTLHSIILAAALLLACACNKQENGDGRYIEKVECRSVQDNALRVSIDIRFTRDCGYSISYWPKNDPSKTITTKTSHSKNQEGHDILLFLYPESTYCFKVNTGEPSETFEFQTYSLPPDMPQYTVKEGQDCKIPGYIFQTQIGKAGYITFADTDGRVIWYQYIDQPARMFDVCEKEGVIWLLTGFKEGDGTEFQRLTKRIMCIDLFGNIIHQWSISDGEIDIPYAHHEIRRMPDGNIVAVTNFTREFDLTPMGGKPGTTIWGDGFTIFNTDGKVIRTWDIFGEIDPLNCDYVNPLKKPLDLVHANSFNWDSEGNYYMTFNNTSQLWKIDSKSGEVLYRVGPGGNVSIDESGFAQGLHNAIPLAPDRILCLDNGRERKSSRAVIYKIDPDAMTAEVELSVSLAQNYSSRDRSGVELILDGSMLMFGMTVSHYVVFTDLEGKVLKSVERDGMSYRTHYLEKLPEY